MKNTIIKSAVIPTAALLSTACSEAERTEAPQAIATLYTLQSASMTDSPRVAADPVAYYHINANAGYITARTTDGKRIYSSSFTLILKK